MEGKLPDILKKSALSGLGISIIAGIILSILGPYQTIQFPFITRMIYWTSLTFVGGLGAYLFLPMAKRLGISASSWLIVLGQSFTASIAVTACLVGLDMFRNETGSISDILTLLFFVWVISIVIATIAHLAEGAARKPAKETRAAIYERVKPALRNSEIYALTAEDHYVRVITSKGEDLILMRLADAIKEVSPLPGMMTHRSWWVAEAGVTSVKKSDGKMSIELHTEQSVPVSRSHQKAVRDAGWA